eukprot:TRINITY_DN7968_c0_g1_i2.p4 TRINITY_DN7968_c0_g1~~TRINITY_DN7968_c0_g1_i2.p4  ORF type:complete len:129 (-),score=24.96 TRINITY_DN7968_c0_g1_i2:300-686(-)
MLVLTCQKDCAAEVAAAAVAADGEELAYSQRHSDAGGDARNQQMHLALHELGKCTPCGYYARKRDGCRNGMSCDFCHFCDSVAYQSWKRRARRSRKREELGLQEAAREAQEDRAAERSGQAAQPFRFQ